MATAVIVLTGEPGAGKSTAAAWFARQGATLLDADAIVREMWNGTKLPQLARERWGDEVFLPGGMIDKKAVAAHIFADAEDYKWLCGVTHPFVYARMAASLPQQGVTVAEIPMFFENPRPLWADKVLFIYADRQARAERNIFRGLDSMELSRRDKFFKSRKERIALSDWVICNDGEIERLYASLEPLWNSMKELAARRTDR